MRGGIVRGPGPDYSGALAHSTIVTRRLLGSDLLGFVGSLQQ